MFVVLWLLAYYGVLALVWDQVVAGSNPVTPTKFKSLKMSKLKLVFNAIFVSIRLIYVFLSHKICTDLDRFHYFCTECFTYVSPEVKQIVNKV